jgi:hypothetical protein
MVPVILVAVGLAAPAQPAGLWANKLFQADILADPGREPPPAVVHDFGPVPKGTLCQHTFTLTNIYDVPLQVIDTNPGCACLAAYPPQRVLQPTETAEFVVTLDTRLLTAPGPTSRTLKVTVGGQEFQGTAVFRLSVDARAEVSLTPGELAFGTVAVGERKRASVVLDYQGRQPGWKVTGVRPGGLPATVEHLGRSRYRLTAELPAAAAPGRLTERVALATTDPAMPVVLVPATGVVLAPVTVSPDGPAVFPRPVKVGERDEVSVILRSNGRPFAVRPVPDAGDGVSADTFGFAGPTQVVKLRFQPARPGAVSRVIRLETDLPGRPAVTVRVEAVGE